MLPKYVANSYSKIKSVGTPFEEEWTKWKEEMEGELILASASLKTFEKKEGLGFGLPNKFEALNGSNRMLDFPEGFEDVDAMDHDINQNKGREWPKTNNPK